MTDYQTILQKLYSNLNILREREAKYGGNVPLDLLNQITDHEQAIRLTEQAIQDEITEQEWQEAFEVLLVAINQRTGEAQIRISIGDVNEGMVGSIVAGGDVSGNIINVYTRSEGKAVDDEAPTPGEPPFKGLEFFDEEDVDLFFGREQLTAQLVGHLREHRILTVVGASGSGKSSVVRAGVVPAIRRGGILADGTPTPQDCIHWPVHVITPTNHPLKELAASMTQNTESVRATAALMDDLTEDPRSLDLVVHRILSQSKAKHLLLVVDQLEELFTLCKDEVERQAFIDALLHAAVAEEDAPTIVVIALRADFYAHCAQYSDLRDVLAKFQIYIGPMIHDELRQAIEVPAKNNGWDFEPGLVNTLLREVGDEPGALPLLSHALLETWKRRQGTTLTLRGFIGAGGVHGAIAKTAETVFQQLTSEQQPIARNIFLQLTELGEGTQDTRRRVSLLELIPAPNAQPDVEEVLKILADARLVTTQKEGIEVAHEALIREWPLLRRWLDEDREALRFHRRLAAAVAEWERNGKDPSYLFQGSRLQQAIEWAEITPRLNSPERTFIEAGLAEQQRGEQERAQWLAAMAHDIRTPIFSIMGYSQLLLQRPDMSEEHTLSMLQTIERSARHISEMVNDLLELSRFSTGRVQLEHQSVDLPTLIEEAIEQLELQATTKMIDVNLNINNSIPAIEADPARLKQAILNLIDNAIKYNRPNGSVDITLTCNESSVELSVHDTGSGIPSDELDSIFDSFYRIHDSEHDEGGIGLGLTIVRQIIEAHNGKIRVESELGVGSTFSLRLPLKDTFK
jgi:signal transduction histidine kinase